MHSKILRESGKNAMIIQRYFALTSQKQSERGEKERNSHTKRLTNRRGHLQDVATNKKMEKLLPAHTHLSRPEKYGYGYG